MATPKIKATYSLDPKTVRALERAAEQWNVSKSEVVRRAIEAIATLDDQGAQDRALAALDALQSDAAVKKAAASGWQARSRRERRAYSRRRESGSS